MSIQLALLGYLSWQPLSGYDLKKLIAGAPASHWSGNNNQIYRSLVELHNSGLVSVETLPNDGVPPRKVYTISEAGRAALAEWLHQPPAPPDTRHPFLMQLAWAEGLSDADLMRMVEQYAHEIEMALLVAEETLRRGGSPQPARSPREAFVWEMIAENRLAALRAELAWAQEVRRGLTRLTEGQSAG